MDRNLLMALFDAVIDGGYTAVSTLTGYMVANGQLVMPSKVAILAAGLMGLGGALNQLRALRKNPNAQ